MSVAPNSGGSSLDRHFVSPLVTIIAVMLPLLSIGVVLDGPQSLGLLVYREQVAGLMLGAAAAIVFFRGASSTRPAEALSNIGLGLASLAVGAWIFVRFPVLSEQGFQHPTEGLLLGAALLIVCVEGLRRVVGLALVVILGLLLLYALFGDYVPGPLRGRALPLADVLRFLGSDSTATLGQSLQVAAFVVVPFLLFGALLVLAGGGDVFTRWATLIAGRGHGNTAKIAVVASALFGSISGSAVSNVMSTGVVTIPLMKRAGLKPQVAGAIEAVASTGGQLMPPVMGAAAFLMAEFLRVPYSTIVIAATIPALLYYLSVYTQIDFLARRLALPALDVANADAVGMKAATLAVVVAFTVLLGSVFSLNVSAEVGAIYATVALLALLVSVGGNSGRISIGRLLDVLRSCGISIADVVLVTSVAGMIIGLLTTTGLGFALTLSLLSLGESSLLLLLAVTALIAIVLGMGLPTTGVYLLLATLAAPPLIKLGVDPLSAHMFVFYYGMLSMITPPVAMAAFAAASLAGASQTATAFQAFRFGWIAYFLPILFVYQPGLLAIGTFVQIGFSLICAITAIVLVTAGLVGHGLRPIGLPARIVAILLGLLTLLPQSVWTGGLMVDVVSVLAGMTAVAGHVFMTRRQSKTPAAQRIAAGRI